MDLTPLVSTQVYSPAHFLFTPPPSTLASICMSSSYSTNTMCTENYIDQCGPSYHPMHGIQVESYIVEFECRVRNITFVEKYMSVSASGGTGRVATSVSCFGGLGQLYRVKVWAVSGPNISQQALHWIAYQMGSAERKVGGL